MKSGSLLGWGLVENLVRRILGVGISSGSVYSGTSFLMCFVKIMFLDFGKFVIYSRMIGRKKS